MTKFAGAVTIAIVEEFGPAEILRWLPDPWKFQAFGWAKLDSVHPISLVVRIVRKGGHVHASIVFVYIGCSRHSARLPVV